MDDVNVNEVKKEIICDIVTIEDYCYVFNNSIGQGSFGTVYEGYHAKNKNLKVAIKAFKRRLPKYEEIEEDILNKLKGTSPNLVTLLTSVRRFTQRGYDLFLIMEYCDLRDLSSYLQSKRKLNIHILQDFFRQIGNGLNELNKRNLVHRDLKPQNILLCRTTNIQEYPNNIIVKIGDFGVAKFLPPGLCIEHTCEIGTPQYMAPEVFLQVRYDKTDFWALGVMMYECSVGSVNFIAQNLTKVSEVKRFYQSLAENGESLDLVVPLFTPLKLQDLLSKLLQMDPDQRIGLNDFIHHPFFKYDRKITEKMHRNQNIIKGGMPVQNDEKNEKAIAIHGFEGENNDELSLKKNDIVTVMDRSRNDWWTGKLDDKIGIFPAIFVKLETEIDASTPLEEESSSSDVQNNKKLDSNSIVRPNQLYLEPIDEASNSQKIINVKNDDEDNSYEAVHKIKDTDLSPTPSERDSLKKENLKTNSQKGTKNRTKSDLDPESSIEQTPVNELKKIKTPPIQAGYEYVRGIKKYVTIPLQQPVENQLNDQVKLSFVHPLEEIDSYTTRLNIFKRKEQDELRMNANRGALLTPDNRLFTPKSSSSSFKEIVESESMSNFETPEENDTNVSDNDRQSMGNNNNLRVDENPVHLNQHDSGVGGEIHPIEVFDEPYEYVGIHYSVRGKYNWYKDLLPGELPIRKGELLEVIDHPDPASLWWKAKNYENLIGLVPMDFVIFDDNPKTQIEGATKQEFNEIIELSRRLYRESNSDKPLKDTIQSLTWYYENILPKISRDILMKRGSVGDFILTDDDENDNYKFVVKTRSNLKEFDLKIVSNELNWFLIKENVYHSLEDFLNKFTEKMPIVSERAETVYLKMPVDNQLKLKPNYYSW